VALLDGMGSHPVNLMISAEGLAFTHLGGELFGDLAVLQRVVTKLV
jgi:hypothetical protein